MNETMTLAEYVERFVKPWSRAFAEEYKAMHPEEYKRALRNARRRRRYAERKAAE